MKAVAFTTSATIISTIMARWTPIWRLLGLFTEVVDLDGTAVVWADDDYSAR